MLFGLITWSWGGEGGSWGVIRVFVFTDHNRAIKIINSKEVNCAEHEDMDNAPKQKTARISYGIEQKRIQKKILSALSSKTSEEKLPFVMLRVLVLLVRTGLKLLILISQCILLFTCV